MIPHSSIVYSAWAEQTCSFRVPIEKSDASHQTPRPRWFARLSTPAIQLVLPRLLWSMMRGSVAKGSAMRGWMFGSNLPMPDVPMPDVPGQGRALIVGTQSSLPQTKIGQTANDVIAPSQIGCVIVGMLQIDLRDRVEFCGLPVLGQLDDLNAVVREYDIDTVFLALPWSERAVISDVAARIARLPVHVKLLPGRVSGRPGFTGTRAPLSGAKAILKRTEDLVLASLLLLILAPLMLIIAILVKLESPGPVLFRQPRQGLNGRLFEVYKFRSMRVDMLDYAASLQTSRADPRLTRVGRLIRSHSLDELPQLFNVLLGSMSIVGPRPHALGTCVDGLPLDAVVRSYERRCQVKPGMTGWAQVNGWRGALDSLEKLERRVDHDLHYIENWSLLLDLHVLARTLPCLLHDSNAF
jgi:exopolysaccharide biosynthesis polyprenyl glycosylphosphotransferase